MSSSMRWIKLKTNFFDDTKIKLIDSMPERDTILIVLVKLFVQAGLSGEEGLVYLDKDLGYSVEMLSTIFNRPMNSIRLALEILCGFNIIEISDNNIIKIKNWNKHQDGEKLRQIREVNRIRKQRERERKRNKEILKEENMLSQKSHVTVTQQTKTKTKIKEKEIDIEILLNYFESKVGSNKTLNKNLLAKAIESHGETFVKMAMDIAITAKNTNMRYINGILKNWEREGYPEGEKGNDWKGSGYSAFKCRKGKVLTEEERKEVEKNLI